MARRLSALIVVPMLWAALADQVTGDWTLAFDPDFGGRPGTSVECTFTQDGERLTGRCGESAAITGQVKGRAVTFQARTGLKNEHTATFDGTLDRSAQTIAGSWTFVDQDGKHDGKFTATRH
jgi:hypothetical protein